MKDIELAYMAGIIDSDGCISIQKHTACSSYRPYMTIIQRDMALIEWLYANFKGSVNVVSTKRNDGRDFYLRWLIADGRMIEILKMCLPYLLLKKGQAEVAIELYELRKRTIKTGRYNSYEAKDIQLQKNLYCKIRLLNSPATTERVGSLTREMRQSELTQMKNRQSAIRSEAPLVNLN